ncbi:MAG: hypothetical protein AAFY34_05260 [Pseudomonadota bacterium]
MEYSALLFAFAVIPVFYFLRSLQKLRRCLTSARARRQAIMEMPAIVLFLPMLITAAMLIESHLDSEFLSRSFVSDGDITTTDLMMFSYDQALKGALFDAIEVFNLSVTNVTHKCDSVLFCTSLLLFRTSISLALSILIFSIYLSITHTFRRQPAEDGRGH